MSGYGEENQDAMNGYEEEEEEVEEFEEVYEEEEEEEEGDDGAEAEAAAAAAEATAAEADGAEAAEATAAEAAVADERRSGGGGRGPADVVRDVDAGVEEARDADSGGGGASGKIFVGGVAWETTQETFTKHFQKYGAITDSVIMKDKHTRMPRGFGFITFSDPSVLDRVLEDEHVIDGRTVEVKRTVPKEEMSLKDGPKDGSKGGPKTKKIFVGGIPPSLTEDKLKDHFSMYGKIVEHQIMLDHSTGRSRGFGFVTFESEDAVERVIYLMCLGFEHCALFVEFMANNARSFFFEICQDHSYIMQELRTQMFTMADGALKRSQGSRNRYALESGKRVEIKKAEPKKSGGGDSSSNGRRGGGHRDSYRGSGGSGSSSGGGYGYGGGYRSAAAAYYGSTAYGAYGRGYGYGGTAGYGSGYGSAYGGSMYGGPYGAYGAYGGAYGGGMYGAPGGYGAGGYGGYGMPFFELAAAAPPARRVCRARAPKLPGHTAPSLRGLLLSCPCDSFSLSFRFPELMESSSSYAPYLRTHLQQIAASVSTASCGAADDDAEECRDEGAALGLKMVAVASILVAGAAGVAIPLVGRRFRGRGRGSPSTGGAFVLAKAFAAGVILATGFVHMLHDADEALTDPCLPAVPWHRFPFPGFVAMLAALGTLVVDFVGTHVYERKHRADEAGGASVSSGANASGHEETAALLEDGAIVASAGDVVVARDGGGGHNKDPMHIVGMRAHAAAHRHSHANGQGSCDGAAVHDGHGHGHRHGHDDEGPSQARHVVVSQILELGIVSHSVIIGLSLGVSQSPCTIKPLVAALSFHQFFEGFALGGCISEAHFKNFSALMMAFFFAITTPAGITVGAGIASFYNPNSPRALVVEGILDSMSAGILIYMALVDLIAADFLSKRMSCNPKLQVGSYIALFLGAMAMASLAIWA
ncbi:hypothetical protein U9M48_027258 [Paspalum notatum var. saurae]|uniref:RRM domain-containing protein n=1 Tax=Paspalum notatum var. saurae TaxID=547442 RepID=A0AAQ3WZE1_PASNO